MKYMTYGLLVMGLCSGNQLLSSSNVDTTAPSLESKFLSAAIDGKSSVLQECISTGVNLDARAAGSGATALQLAAFGNHTTCVEILLSASKSNIDDFDSHGKSAVHVAAFLGHKDVLIQLLEAGAFIDNVNPLTGLTPLHMAVLRTQTTSVRTLAQCGADINARTPSNATALHFAAVGGEKGYRKVEEDLFYENNDSENEKIAHILLQFGADSKAQQQSGITPLDLAEHFNNRLVKKLLTRQCAQCGKSAVWRICSKCKGKAYCNRDCQSIHWEVHKRECYESPLLRSGAEANK